MTMISFPLPESRIIQLRDRAKQVGLTPEEFLSRYIEQLLDVQDVQFRNAADHVLKKNAELYRRLS